MKDFTQEELVDLRIAVATRVGFFEERGQQEEADRFDKLWDKLYDLGLHDSSTARDGG